jgi:hypothetical protein
MIIQRRTNYLQLTDKAIFGEMHPAEIRASMRSLHPSPHTKPKVIHSSLSSCGHWPLHKMSITPNIIMIFIDIQGEEHHNREEQGILGF